MFHIKSSKFFGNVLGWNFLWRHSTVCWSWEQWDVHNSKLLGLETYIKTFFIVVCPSAIWWWWYGSVWSNKLTKSFSNGLKPNRWQKFFLLSVLLFNLRWLHVRLGRPGPPPNMDANNIRYTANHCPSCKYMDTKNSFENPPFSEQSSESSQRNLCSHQNPKASQNTNGAKKWVTNANQPRHNWKCLTLKQTYFWHSCIKCKISGRCTIVVTK